AIERRSSRRRPDDRFSLRLPSKLGARSPSGWPLSTAIAVDTCFRAAFGSDRISRRGSTPALSMDGWSALGLDSSAYGTRSLRRTKAAQIYRKTGNLRAVQLLLGHTKLESTVRYLGIEVDDVLTISEQIEL